MDQSGIVKGSPHETRQRIMAIVGAASGNLVECILLFVFCGLGIVSTVPLLRAIGQAPSISYAFFMLLIALAIISFYTSISGVVKAELFPAEIRALGVGVSYAIGNAIFGGTAEYVALSFKANGVEWGFAWYVVAVLCVALMSVIAMPDMQKAGHMARDDDPVA